MAHHEVPVRVTAWVDEGVADLVSALNDWPGIITLDSCESDYRTGRARVSFCTHERGQIASVVTRLAAAIDSGGLGERVQLAMWPPCDDDLPGADITCPSSLVPAVAEALASCARRRQSPHDTGGTAPRS
jgi:hypothetical protein